MKKHEIIVEMRRRLGLDKKILAEILRVDVKKFEKMESVSEEPDTQTWKLLCEMLDIDEEKALSEDFRLGTLHFTYKIDREKFDNIYAAYMKMLKKFFSGPWKVYVLSRVKVRRGWKNFFDLFFFDSRTSVEREMKAFAPSFLVRQGNINLLVHFEKDILNIVEIGDIALEKRFVYDGFRYSRANRVRLK